MIFGGEFLIDVEHVPAGTTFGGSFAIDHEFIIVQGRTTFGGTFRVVIDPALIPNGETEFGGTSRILGTHSLTTTDIGGTFDLEETESFTTFVWDGWDWVPSRQRVRTEQGWRAA